MNSNKIEQQQQADNYSYSFLRKFQRDPLSIVGTFILTTIIISVIFLPFIYNVDFAKIDFSRATLPPSLEHPFGTNALGQDQLARILLGGRISLAVALAAMTVAITLGTSIGAIAGFYGGIVDSILMRLTDLFLSLPQLPSLLLIVYLFRDGVKTIFGANFGIFVLIFTVIGGLNWMSVARLVRANFLKFKEMEFVAAAKTLGAKPSRIIWRHILPNVLNIIIVASTLAVGNAILTESTLSFLGIGFPPDLPTWGRMLYDAKDYLTSAPHMAIFPGLAIFLTVLCINYIGDGLRDALDPKN
jgi:peptide/nickel transport system permease protein